MQAPGPADGAIAAKLAEGLRSGSIRDREALQKTKLGESRRLGVAAPTDADVAHRLPADLRTRFAALLRTKPTRSRSGVAVVAVMSSPAACPHGKCTFCPGGPEVGVPQSYTGFEPSTMRAIRHAYDPYRIVRGRLAQLQRNGHAIDKVEIVVQGGTFPAREQAYQDWFAAGTYAGLNDGPSDEDLPWQSEAEWSLQGDAERLRRLAMVMHANESAPSRCVGLTIETKPDWCLEPHVDGMLRLGATRVEVGIQTLDEGVLLATHRGHTLDDSRNAMRIARDAGFKVCAHMMPGLPRQGKTRLSEVASSDLGMPGLPRQGKARLDGVAAGDLQMPGLPRQGKARLDEVAAGDLGMPGLRRARHPSTDATDATDTTHGRLDPDPEADVEDMRRLFAEADWRPDMLKIYPTLVVMEGETLLKRQWERGEYHPYDSSQAAEVIARGKAFVPEYCRIQRVDRDIPTTHVEAGVMNSNLRQIVHERMAAAGTSCRCIRCREAGHRADEGRPVDAENLMLVRRDYDASGAMETFLSLEDAQADAVAAFLRLRRVGPDAHRAETQGVAGGVAFIRELKVYGTALALGESDDPDEGTWQHRGFGARLLAEAERVAFSEWGVGRLLVIAGVGVKEYYRQRGYSDCGAYVAKDKA
ncbi:MAG: radical SAM protein [bacterium]